MYMYSTKTSHKDKQSSTVVMQVTSLGDSMAAESNELWNFDKSQKPCWNTEQWNKHKSSMHDGQTTHMLSNIADHWTICAAVFGEPETWGVRQHGSLTTVDWKLLRNTGTKPKYVATKYTYSRFVLFY